MESVRTVHPSHDSIWPCTDCCSAAMHVNELEVDARREELRQEDSMIRSMEGSIALLRACESIDGRAAVAIPLRPGCCRLVVLLRRSLVVVCRVCRPCSQAALWPLAAGYGVSRGQVITRTYRGLSPSSTRPRWTNYQSSIWTSLEGGLAVLAQHVLCIMASEESHHWLAVI